MMNRWVQTHADRFIRDNAEFTTEDLHSYLRSISPRQAPSRTSVAHYLKTHPLMAHPEGGRSYEWIRLAIPDGIEPLLRAIWAEGAVPMQELRREYGEAVDKAARAGMILRAEEYGRADYILTRRGMAYAQGARA